MFMAAKDMKPMENTNQAKAIFKKRHSCFEWIHLIATICIPVIIAIYTIIENSNSASIAAANQHKDIEIAQANRLNELKIAEASRQKDRDLAMDQQHEDILAQYQSSLADILIADNGTLTKKSSMTKTVLQFMTRTALSQLDLKRRSLLLRSLYDARLITLQASSSEEQKETILEFRQIDLSSVIFGPFSYSQEILPFYHYVEWNYLTLPYSILVNASFRHTNLDCAFLRSAMMVSADLSFIRQQKPICFDIPRSVNTILCQASLVNASFYRSIFFNTDFGLADMTYANMTHFYCRECHFYSTKLVQVELSFSKIFHVFGFTSFRLNFYAANLKGSTMHSAFFNSVNFDQSNWSDVQASKIGIRNSTFNGTMMINCSWVQSLIEYSEFENANLSNIDLNQATFYNVSFLAVDMRKGNLSSMKCTYCYFTDVKFEGVTFKNASFHHSVFIDCLIDDHQLAETFDLTGSTLPNGTVVKTNG